MIKHFPSNYSNAIKGKITYFNSIIVTKTKKDGTGIVFDIYEDQGLKCLEIAEHLKTTDSKIEFEVKRCTVLPDLVEEGGSVGDGWRGN